MIMEMVSVTIKIVMTLLTITKIMMIMITIIDDDVHNYYRLLDYNYEVNLDARRKKSE